MWDVLKPLCKKSVLADGLGDALVLGSGDGVGAAQVGVLWIVGHALTGDIDGDGLVETVARVGIRRGGGILQRPVRRTEILYLLVAEIIGGKIGQTKEREEIEIGGGRKLLSSTRVARE